MKKTIAGIAALTIALSAFTGCTDKKNDKSTASTEAVTTAQDTTEGTTAPDVTDPEEKPEVSEDSYEEVLKEFVDAYNNEDYKKTFELTMPDGAEKVIKLLASSEVAQQEFGGISEDEMIDDSQSALFLGKKEGNLILGEIKDAEPLSEDELYELRCGIAEFAWCVNYIESNGGVDNIDYEDMIDAVMDPDIDTLAAEVKVEEAYNLTFGLEHDQSDWSGEGHVIVYRIKGGGWKVSADDFIGTKVSGTEEKLNSAAQNILRAANTTLVEMDEREALPAVDDAYIVASDDSRNAGVPEDFDTELFRSHLKNYFDYDGDWFVKIQGYFVQEAAVYDPEKPDNVGTYPPSDSADFAYEGMSYDEIYAKACEDIGG